MCIPAHAIAKDKQGDFHLNAGKPEHFQRLFEEINNEHVLTGVVYQWQGQEEDPVAAQSIVSAGLLHTTQALAGLKTPPRLWVVTQNTQSIDATSAIEVQQAPLWGLGSRNTTRTSGVAVHLGRC